MMLLLLSCLVQHVWSFSGDVERLISQAKAATDADTRLPLSEPAPLIMVKPVDGETYGPGSVPISVIAAPFVAIRAGKLCVRLGRGHGALIGNAFLEKHDEYCMDEVDGFNNVVDVAPGAYSAFACLLLRDGTEVCTRSKVHFHVRGAERLPQLALPSGVVHTREYLVHLDSPLCARMGEYAGSFSQRIMDAIQTTGVEYTWARNESAFAQWSRKWEYPFAFEAVKFAASELQRRRGSEFDGTIELLDAGSGVTFFPFWLSSRLPGLQITNGDMNPEWGKLLEALNQQSVASALPVKFRTLDLRDMALADNSADIIQCISVLEHTDNYEQIIGEFARVLRPGGFLVITFDVTLGGRDALEVPPERAAALLGMLQRAFTETNQPVFTGGGADRPSMVHQKVVTTKWIQRVEGLRSSLPWGPNNNEDGVPNLAFSCHVFQHGSGHDNDRAAAAGQAAGEL
jgi:2-polyprenyl-3-methyl-5-hydroxy-6-metoxy-1,4-benzoquinol methylase